MKFAALVLIVALAAASGAAEQANRRSLQGQQADHFSRSAVYARIHGLQEQPQPRFKTYTFADRGLDQAHNLVKPAPLSAAAKKAGEDPTEKLKNNAKKNKVEEQKKELRYGDNIPLVSVAFKCVILLICLHFVVTLIDLVLGSRERALRLMDKDPEAEGGAEYAEILMDAMHGLEEAVASVPMVTVIIVFSHYRIAIYCGYIGEKWKKFYPEGIEMAYWIVTGVIVMEFSVVFIAILLTLCGNSVPRTIRKASSMGMDLALFLGEFATIAAVIYMFVMVLSEERRTVQGVEFDELKTSVIAELF